MGAPLHAPAAPPTSDLDRAECCLLNAELKAKRRVIAGTLTCEEYAGLRVHFDAMWSHLRLLTTALDTPSIATLTYQRGT